MNRILLILLFLPLSAFAQGDLPYKIVAQFNYRQIDSLINVTLDGLKREGVTDAVVNTMWYVGSKVEGDFIQASHNNHFRIYFLFSQNGKDYVQEIDNYSYFGKLQVKAKKFNSFLKQHFTAMQHEELSPKQDTTYEKGDELIGRTVMDRQLLRTVKIIRFGDTLEYKYPSDYSENKKNLDTYRYKFLAYIDEVTNWFDRQHRERKDVKMDFVK